MDMGKQEPSKVEAESSEEYDYEQPDINIQEVIEEMKLRRRNFEEAKKPSASARDVFEDHNPLRAVQESENKNRDRCKLLTLVSRGHCLIGAVFHIYNGDNTAEFDPFFIERIKNCLNLMAEKELVQQLELEITQKHTFKNVFVAQQYEDKLKELDEENEAEDSDEADDVVDLNNYGANRVRSPLKRGRASSGETGQLLTSRGGPAGNNEGHQASVAKQRSIRNPDFIRQSLLSARKSTAID